MAYLTKPTIMSNSTNIDPETKPVLHGPFAQVLTLRGLAERGALGDAQLEVMEAGGILCANGNILAVGIFEELRKNYATLQPDIEERPGNEIALPSWIDAHTHICFAGTRARDFAMRNAGKSYLDIAEAGGGIKDTVAHTRQADAESLKALTLHRLHRHLAAGVTTIEIKSGYGLSPESELKMLRVIAEVQKQTAVSLIPTCLAAHTTPREFAGRNSEYLRMMEQELFPVLIKENLALRMDAFVEKSAFSVKEIRPYLEKAKALGFRLTVHADQFTSGGSSLAVALAADSADHLEASGDPEIRALAQSDVVAVALPGASLGLGMPFTPARKLLDQGAALAIASDWNPGSAPMGDLIAQASILACYEKLSTAEVLAGLTFRAAKALHLHDRGRLPEGMRADFNIYSCSDYREILYQQGKLNPCEVYLHGNKHFHHQHGIR